MLQPKLPIESGSSTVHSATVGVLPQNVCAGICLYTNIYIHTNMHIYTAYAHIYKTTQIHINAHRTYKSTHIYRYIYMFACFVAHMLLNTSIGVSPFRSMYALISCFGTKTICDGQDFNLRSLQHGLHATPPSMVLAADCDFS